jgi:hypothetical protein
MPRIKKDVEIEDEKKDAYDIISEGIQRWCEIPGCRPKFHLEEARFIVDNLRNHGLLKIEKG